MKGAEGRELSSWKEIASYLGVGVRTAQEWERTRALPVRRLPGGRGRVLASVAEIDAWKNTATTRRDVDLELGPPESTPLPEKPVKPSTSRWYWVAIAGGIVLAAFAGLAFWFRPGRPARYRIDHDTLIVSDDAGRELWHKRFPALSEAAYAQFPLVWFGDLNGQPVVLFVPIPSTAAPDSQPLICYSRGGTELWRFVPGRPIRTSAEAFAPPFGIIQIKVAPLGKDRQTRIVVISHHHLYYPCQIALLSAGGTLLREYWHSGHFDHILISPYKGRPEILLGGINNTTKSATLVALDPNTMEGASTEPDPAYQLLGFRPGVEDVRILFPRACFNRLLEPFARVASLDVEDGAIVAAIHQRVLTPSGTLYYHFNLDLSLKSMALGSNFEAEHSRLFATHVLDHKLTAAEAAELQRIRYLRPSAAPGLQ